MLWITAAVFSALFAGCSAILAKCGIKSTDSDAATALRTSVVFVFSWIAVAVAGSFSGIGSISGKTLLFLILSGLATGASWICWFKALSLGNVNKVVPIDKSSTVLTILFALILFREFDNPLIKTAGIILISVGVFLMIEKKAGDEKEEKRGWLLFAVLSALFATATSILAKVGISGVESNLGTAIRTCVVLPMSFLIVLLKKKGKLMFHVGHTDLFFILLSGLATGASWLCYYYALQNGVVSAVVPIDKMSLLVTVVFSRIFLGEKLSVKGIIGLVLMLGGTLLMVFFA